MMYIMQYGQQIQQENIIKGFKLNLACFEKTIDKLFVVGIVYRKQKIKLMNESSSIFEVFQRVASWWNCHTGRLCEWTHEGGKKAFQLVIANGISPLSQRAYM